MLHSLLDRWDEKKAARSEAIKRATGFRLDANLAFEDVDDVTTIEGFIQHATLAANNPGFFGQDLDTITEVDRNDQWITFPSQVVTSTPENNTVTARISDGPKSRRAMILFHHWNANSRYDQIAKYFNRRGIAVIEMAMPYHHERSRPGSEYADHMLSPSLGRTLQSVRQAVLDGRQIVRWLEREGYDEISVLGMSLGSWVAGLLAAHDPAVKNAALFLTADSLAEMCWTGRATRHIHESLEGTISLTEFQQAWLPLDLGHHAGSLSRNDLHLQLVLGKRDTVVLPALSHRLTEKLTSHGANLDVLSLNCGHYSLTLPPYILWAGRVVTQLINDR